MTRGSLPMVQKAAASLAGRSQTASGEAASERMMAAPPGLDADRYPARSADCSLSVPMQQ